jgi:ABC-2 type transport system permease protein
MMTFIKKEFLELWRSKKILIIFIILAIISMTSIIMSKFEPQLIKALLAAQGTELPESIAAVLEEEPTVIQAVSNLFGNIANILVWVIILTTATAVNSEYINSTFALYLNTPKTRLTASKFISRIAVYTASILLSAAIALLYIAVLFEPEITAGFLPCLLILIVYAFFTTAYSLLFSAVFKTVLKSIGFSIFFYILLNIFSSLPLIGSYLPGGFGVHMSAFLSGSVSPGFVPFLIVNAVLIMLCLYLSNEAAKKYRI